MASKALPDCSSLLSHHPIQHVPTTVSILNHTFPTPSPWLSTNRFLSLKFFFPPSCGWLQFHARISISKSEKLYWVSNPKEIPAIPSRIPRYRYHTLCSICLSLGVSACAFVARQLGDSIEKRGTTILSTEEVPVARVAQVC